MSSSVMGREVQSLTSVLALYQLGRRGHRRMIQQVLFQSVHVLLS